MLSSSDWKMIGWVEMVEMVEMTRHDEMMDWAGQIGKTSHSGEKSSDGLNFYYIDSQSLHIQDY